MKRFLSIIPYSWNVPHLRNEKIKFGLFVVSSQENDTGSIDLFNLLNRVNWIVVDRSSLWWKSSILQFRLIKWLAFRQTHFTRRIVGN